PSQPEPAPEPKIDPYGYAKLTEDALLDLANGLRADLDDEKAKRKAAEAERDRFKDANRDLSQSNQGATISRLKSQIQAMK
ncbi:hypothetical protein, partial [Escherichia coli]|uniref:hypothetical protein n=1 Tax=Escherichia coli TaxID=562 RepID=UPI001934967F